MLNRPRRADGTDEALPFSRAATHGELSFPWTSLSLVFQPIVRLCDESVVGAEALIRMSRNGLTLNGAETMNEVRDADVERELTTWVARRVVHAGRQLFARLSEPSPYLTFNVSSLAFNEPYFAIKLRDVWLSEGMSTEGFVVELTETDQIDDWAAAEDSLRALHAAGFMVAVDDFGSGYSNLVQLQHLDIDMVKLDRELVMSAMLSNRRKRVTAGAIQLAHSVGAVTVAEGLESADMSREMQRLGCELGQGFGIARPMPLAALLDWVERHSAPSLLFPEPTLVSKPA